MDWWADYIGIPFVPGGRGIDGMDCWGLVVDVYRQYCGIRLPSLSEEYRDVADPGQVLPLLEREAAQWVECGPGPFAVAMMRLNGGNHLHVGVMIDGTRMLHATPKADVVVEPVATRFGATLIGYYRIKLDPHPPERQCPCIDCLPSFND